MSIEPEDRLTESLKDLTWWTGPAPGLWKRALKVAGKPFGWAKGTLSVRRGLWTSEALRQRSRAVESAGTVQGEPGRLGRVARVLRSRWPWVGVPIAAMLVMAVTMTAHERARRINSMANLAGVGKGAMTYAGRGGFFSGIDYSDSDGVRDANGRWYFGQASYGYQVPNGDKADGKARGGITVASGVNPPSSTPSSIPGDRHVIRKAAVDLQAEDVRGVYLKIKAMLPNEAQGEFVEQSQLVDSGGQVSGYLTLRLRADRLNEALNTLRGMATVVREASDATDVTAQVVDVEARLRNERRVEQELLALLERRKDAPLEDVLKVSNSLAEVRGRIESLTADQQRTARQVALATLVVTIQAKPREPAPVARPGMMQRLGEQFGGAWRDGVAFLVDTMAAMVRILIGGLIWWALLVAGLWMLRRWYLRRVGMTNAEARGVKSE